MAYTEADRADSPEQDVGEERMDEQEVQSTLYLLTSDAIQYNQEMMLDREDAMDLYLGKKLGNEEDGRSTFVYTVTRNVINMIMPSLMRIFFGGDRYVEYSPRSMQAIEGAEQATEFISDTVIAEDNPGFMIIHNWFLDALIKKSAAVKWWRDEQYNEQSYSATVVIPEFLQLQQDPEIKIESVKKSKIYGNLEVEYTQTRDESMLKFAAVPAWEFLISRTARDVATATFVGHRCLKTVSELRSMGIPDEIIEEYGHKDASLDGMAEKATQSPTESNAPGVEETGPRETQRVTYVEGYPFLDLDRDGIAELVRVPMIGPGLHIVYDMAEPVARRPFALICPHPIPHEVFGQSEADFTKPLQRIMSMIARSMLDSLALSLHPRMGYIEGEVAVEDIMNTEIGAPIRMERQESAFEYKHSFVGGDALPVLQFFENLVETTTGVTKAAEGLNADAMQSSTRAAVTNTITAAQQQIELIARIFAETGFKDLMRGLLEETVAHSPRKRITRIRGAYVEVDPRAWDATMDVRINVAMGAGLVDDQVATLSGLAEKMEASFQTMGPSNPLTNLGRYRALLVKIAKLKGRKDAEMYFNPMPLDWAPPPAPPQPSPEDQIAQAEMMKAQADMAKKQADVQFQQQQGQLEMMRQSADLQLKRDQMMLDAKIEETKLEAMLLIENAKLQATVQSADQKLQVDAQVKQIVEQMRGENKLAIAEASKSSGEKIIRIQKYDVETGKPSEVSVETSSDH